MSSVNSTSSVAMYGILSKRGKEELVVQNYTFSIHKKTCGWGISVGMREPKVSCIFNNCRRIFAKIEEFILEHNYEEIEMHILQRQDVPATAKRKAIENLSESPSKIVCASVSENHKNLQVDDLKKGCELGFPYCFLTDFTNFYL